MLISNQNLNKRNIEAINVKGFFFSIASAIVIALLVVATIDPKLLPW